MADTRLLKPGIAAVAGGAKLFPTGGSGTTVLPPLNFDANDGPDGTVVLTWEDNGSNANPALFYTIRRDGHPNVQVNAPTTEYQDNRLPIAEGTQWRISLTTVDGTSATVSTQWPDPAPGVTYLLSANFNATDYIFSNGEDVNTGAPGSVQAGAGTVFVNSGLFPQIVNGELTSTGTGTNCGVAWDPIAREVGLTIIERNKRPTGGSTSLGINVKNANTTTTLPTDRVDGLLLNNSPADIVHLPNNVSVKIATIQDDVYYDIAWMAGGYDSSGVPYQIGDNEADFRGGSAAFFKKDGDPDWLLGYRAPSGTGTIYNQTWPRLAGVTDDLRIPDADLSDLLQPNNLSTTIATGYTFTHIADCLIESIVTTLPTSGNYDIEFRVQDAANKWICRTTSAGVISLVEVVAGGETTRIGPIASAVANGDRVVIVADDEDIAVYSADVSRGTYGLAASFKTATGGEVVFGSGAIQYVSDYSRGTDGAYSDFNNYPGAA